MKIDYICLIANELILRGCHLHVIRFQCFVMCKMLKNKRDCIPANRTQSHTEAERKGFEPLDPK